MRHDKETSRVYVRQSWLGSYLICPQRARYDLTMPGLRRGSDATAIGTAVHSAIEGYLLGEYNDLDSMISKAHECVEFELSQPNIRLSKISADPEQLRLSTVAMVVGWWDTVRPSVALGGLVEHKFKAPLIVGGDTELWLEGTMDYVAPDGTIWDWKTAGKSYSAKEKQKQSHQATCYVAAARTLGLVDNGDAPTLFRFGVMVRQTTPKAQIVTVERTPAHVDWLKRQVASVCTTATAMGVEREWAINDQHNLCSPMWCDYWTMCKGAHWSSEDMEPPSQDVPVIVDTEHT